MTIPDKNRDHEAHWSRPLWVSLWIFFALVLLLALVARLPASLVLAGFDRWGGLPDTITWGEAYGSVWNGGIEGLQTPGGQLGGMSWEFQPRELLHGGLAAAIQWHPPGGDIRGNLRLDGGNLELSAVEGSLLAATLNQWDTGIPLVLDGRLYTNSLQLRIDRDGAVESASGRISWQNAAAGLQRPVPLGEQRAGIHEKAQGLKIDLYSAPNAELGITGTVQLNLKTRPPAVDARISLQPRAHADLAITQFLENNPDRDDQGRYLWTTGPAPSKAQIAR